MPRGRGERRRQYHWLRVAIPPAKSRRVGSPQERFVVWFWFMLFAGVVFVVCATMGWARVVLGLRRDRTWWGGTAALLFVMWSVPVAASASLLSGLIPTEIE